jgi:hypothetical protein
MQSKVSSPTGTMVTVPITRAEKKIQPMVSVQVGDQSVQLLMDTGSSWMVVNEKDLGNLTNITKTGETATVNYGSGSLFASGPICIAPVSIGGLEPLPMKFLLKTSGTYGAAGTIGINTWLGMANNQLDIPMRALKISRYQIRLPPMSSEPGQPSSRPGQWVLNGQPTIDAAPPANVSTFNVPQVSSQSNVLVQAVLTVGNASAIATLLLDSGTPGPTISLWPEIPTKLDYQPGSTAVVTLRATASDGKALELGTIDLGHISAKTGSCVIAGADGVVGNHYIQGFVMGIDLNKRTVSLVKAP